MYRFHLIWFRAGTHKRVSYSSIHNNYYTPTWTQLHGCHQFELLIQGCDLNLWSQLYQHYVRQLGGFRWLTTPLHCVQFTIPVYINSDSVIAAILILCNVRDRRFLYIDQCMGVNHLLSGQHQQDQQEQQTPELLIELLLIIVELLLIIHAIIKKIENNQKQEPKIIQELENNLKQLENRIKLINRQERIPISQLKQLESTAITLKVIGKKLELTGIEFEKIYQEQLLARQEEPNTLRYIDKQITQLSIQRLEIKQNIVHPQDDVIMFDKLQIQTAKQALVQPVKIEQIDELVQPAQSIKGQNFYQGNELADEQQKFQRYMDQLVGQIQEPERQEWWIKRELYNQQNRKIDLEQAKKQLEPQIQTPINQRENWKQNAAISKNVSRIEKSRSRSRSQNRKEIVQPQRFFDEMSDFQPNHRKSKFVRTLEEMTNYLEQSRIQSQPGLFENDSHFQDRIQSQHGLFDNDIHFQDFAVEQQQNIDDSYFQQKLFLSQPQQFQELFLEPNQERLQVQPAPIQEQNLPVVVKQPEIQPQPQPQRVMSENQLWRIYSTDSESDAPTQSENEYDSDYQDVSGFYDEEEDNQLMLISEESDRQPRRAKIRKQPQISQQEKIEKTRKMLAERQEKIKQARVLRKMRQKNPQLEFNRDQHELLEVAVQEKYDSKRRYLGNINSRPFLTADHVGRVIPTVMLLKGHPNLLTERNKDQESQLGCSICLQKFTTKQQLRRLQCCRNLYHIKCLNGWILTRQEQSCPLCRKVI